MLRDMIRLFKKLYLSEKGATAVEYGLILAFVALASLVALSNLANETVGMWNEIADKVVEKP